MSEKEQTQDQAPAPFRVGDKVRCVDVRGYQSAMGVERNVVYEVEEFKPPCELVLRGKGPSHLSRCFVPAVAFVDRDGDRWLVVDERVPDTHKDTWAEAKTSGEPNGYVARAGSGFIPSCHINGGRRRILAEWVEFPAPEAKAVTEAEPSSETITMSKTHHGWLQNRILDLENARRELALVVGVLDGTITAPEHRSDAVDRALGVVKERDHFKATVNAVWTLIKLHSYPIGTDCLTRVVERLLVGQRPDRSDWQVKCAEARSERDAALVRVAELEAERKAGSTFAVDILAEMVRENHPTATSWQLFVNAQGYEIECKHTASTEGASFKMLNGEWSPRAALAGKREGA